MSTKQAAALVILVALIAVAAVTLLRPSITPPDRDAVGTLKAYCNIHTRAEPADCEQWTSRALEHPSASRRVLDCASAYGWNDDTERFSACLRDGGIIFPPI